MHPRFEHDKRLGNEKPIKVVHSKEEEPYTIEVDKEMPKGLFFVKCPEKDPIPNNAVEFHEAFGWGNRYRLSLIWY